MKAVLLIWNNNLTGREKIHGFTILFSKLEEKNVFHLQS